MSLGIAGRSMNTLVGIWIGHSARFGSIRMSWLVSDMNDERKMVLAYFVLFIGGLTLGVLIGYSVG